MAEHGEHEDEVVSVPLLILTLAVWWLSVWKHDLGLKWAGQVFAWAKAPGTFTAAGGASGMAVFEGYMALAFGSAAVAIMALVAWRLRKVSHAQLLREAVPWATWAALLFLVWKCFIVYATELIHFGQYAVVGFLAAMAIGRGRYPLYAFLLAFGLGLVDEIYQHYWLSAEALFKWRDHWMDFTDPVLDALGAAAAILPFTTLCRLRQDETGQPPPDTSIALRGTFAVLGVVGIVLLSLDPVQVSEFLGNYRVQPYWGEYDNFKPTHWPGPREGVPVLLASFLLLGSLVDPRRKGLSRVALLALVVLAVIGVDPPSRKKGTPVHRPVPYASAAPINSNAITIDGKLDEAVWQQAERLGPFVRTQDGSPVKNKTYARVLWSPHAIYLAFECEDPDIWARDVGLDDEALPGDEVIEVFLDDGGDEVTYFEFEISPKNARYDLFCFIPSGPVDYEHWAPFRSIPNWTAKGIRHAVQIEGELDVVKGRLDPARKLGGDKRWTVEIAIPWNDFKMHPWQSSPVRGHAGLAPPEGTRWRMGLFRFERWRPTLEQEQGGPVMTAKEAEALVDDPAWFARLTDPHQPLLQEVDAEGKPRDRGGHYLRAKVHAYKDEMQAWAPTWHGSGLTHRPYWFGVLEFSARR